ncbi:MAG TPA: isocitrate/isopropylmalate family dehydrogenase, partial [Actinomycetota bacterium]|nr:isocitrate/isopropylmalate family dehydrogenase [Actinomycetota bacterium]
EFVAASNQLSRLRDLVRELTGFEIARDAGVTVKPISVYGTRRIVRFAFDFARRNDLGLVTLGHKANIMTFSDGLFLATAREEAEQHTDIRFEEMQVDQLALQLATEPERFEVLLLPNLYGDIISDLCAGLVGGLGLASGSNVGSEYALFEPVHGSAPDIAGKGVANPIAMILSAAMMLTHLGETAAASAIRTSVARVLTQGTARTRDLGGSSTTTELAEAIADATKASVTSA